MKIIKIVLIVIILVAAILRFIHLKELFFFMVDESTLNLVAKRIVVDRWPVLLGPDIPGGLHTGPVFYYLTSFVMWLSNFNPLGEAVVASIIGVIATYGLFLISRTLFPQARLAFLASLIFAFSSLIIIYNRTYNTLTFSLLAALLVYQSLTQLKKGKEKYSLWLALGLILGTHSEGSAFSLVILTLLFFIFYFPVQKLNRRKVFIKVFMIFLLSFAPLIWFELRHDFVLSQRTGLFFSFKELAVQSLPKTFNNFLSISLTIPKAVARILFLTGKSNISGQILPCATFLKDRNNVPALLIIVGFVLILFFLINWWRQRKHWGLSLISIHFFIVLGGMLLYSLFLPNYFHEWFLVIFFPGFCLMIAYALNFLWEKSKYIAMIFIIGFVLFNLKTVFSFYNPAGLAVKEKAIRYAINRIDNKEFYLDSLGSCYGFGGYRYLFWYYGKEPLYSYADNLYWDWLYNRPKKVKPDLGVVMVNPLDAENEEFLTLYDTYKKITLDSKKFGSIEVLIVKNKPKD